jgi:thiopurine S-methyltransferase
MTPEFWHQRWQRGEIGWHSDAINRHLTEHWPQLRIPAAATVLVPLCGKSLDMLWLAGRGHRVVGIEISPRAAEAFFAENGLRAQVQDLAPLPFVRWSVDEINLLVGDFFAVTPALLQAELGSGIDAVYDRASLIALPPALRDAYSNHLAALLRNCAGPAPPISLLITVDYDQAQMAGPPFAVGDAEVRALFGGDFTIAAIATFDVLGENARFAARGLDRLTEHVYRLEYRAPAASIDAQ